MTTIQLDEKERQMLRSLVGRELETVPAVEAAMAEDETLDHDTWKDIQEEYEEDQKRLASLEERLSGE